MEAIAEYKGYLKDMRAGKNKNPRGIENINRYYDRLKNENN